MLDASSEPLLMPEKRQSRLMAVPEDGDHIVPLPPPAETLPDLERRHPRPHAMHGPRFLSLSRRLAVFVGIVSAAGLAAGMLGAIFGHSTDWLGLLALVALVGAGQALALEVDDGSISVSAVGSHRRRSAVRRPRRALPGGHDRRGRVERAAVAVPLRGLQHRHARARVARGGRVSSTAGFHPAAAERRTST